MDQHTKAVLQGLEAQKNWSKQPTREEVWEVVMECDFSAVLDAIGLGREMPTGLGELVSLKTRMKKHESPEARELRMGRRVKKVLAK
jgi:hypothetical protein